MIELDGDIKIEKCKEDRARTQRNLVFDWLAPSNRSMKNAWHQ